MTNSKLASIISTPYFRIKPDYLKQSDLMDPFIIHLRLLI